jgi:hypothetical protein
MAFLLPNQAAEIFQSVMTTVQLNYERDNLYLGDLKKLLTSDMNLCEMFLNISYMHVRYLESALAFQDISPFEWNESSEFLRLLTGSKVLMVYDLINLFVNTARVSELKIIKPSDRDHGANLCEQVVRKMSKDIDEPMMLSDGWQNLYRFAEYITRVRPILTNLAISADSKDLLLSVSIYYSFLNPTSEMHWLEVNIRIIECISNIDEPFDSISYYKQLQGVLIHSLFVENYIFPKKKLKEISDWIVSRYKKYLDFWEDQVVLFKSSIDSSQHNSGYLQACSKYLMHIKLILQAFQFEKWSVSSLILKQADRVLVGLQWCEFKLNSL